MNGYQSFEALFGGIVHNVVHLDLACLHFFVPQRLLYFVLRVGPIVVLFYR